MYIQGVRKGKKKRKKKEQWYSSIHRACRDGMAARQRKK
jgi:hypothetical protein